MKILNKTFNGQLTFCECCNTYSLEFGNFFFCFTEAGYQNFRRYVNSIYGDLSIQNNQHFASNRKICIKIQSESIYFCLNKMELEELKELLSARRNGKKSPYLAQNYSLN